MKQLICIIASFLAIFVTGSSNAANVRESQLADKQHPTDKQENVESKGAKQNLIIWEAFYEGSSFKDVKKSGSYGFAITGLMWKLEQKWKVGFNYSMGVNMGLVKDINIYTFKLGPAIGTQFGNNIIFSVPLDLVGWYGSYYDGDAHKSKDSFEVGMAISPTLYLKSGRFGVMLGPMLTIPFYENGSTEVGFRAGITIDW